MCANRGPVVQLLSIFGRRDIAYNGRRSHGSILAGPSKHLDLLSGPHSLERSGVNFRSELPKTAEGGYGSIQAISIRRVVFALISE
jgi:hypothetical protein